MIEARVQRGPFNVASCCGTCTDVHYSDCPVFPERSDVIRLGRVHRCTVIDEHGRPCQTWTLQARCLKHRRQRQACGDEL